MRNDTTTERVKVENITERYRKINDGDDTTW